MRLLLISNGGKPYLEHCRDQIAAFLKPITQPDLITAAYFGDETQLLEKVQTALAPVGIRPRHLRWDANPISQLASSQAVLMTGGNTYLLLKRLQESGLLGALRERVRSGLPYAG